MSVIIPFSDPSFFSQSPLERWKTAFPELKSRIAATNQKIKAWAKAFFILGLSIVAVGMGASIVGLAKSSYGFLKYGVPTSIVGLFFCSIAKGIETHALEKNQARLSPILCNEEGVRALRLQLIADKPAFDYPQSLVGMGVLSQPVFNRLEQLREEHDIICEFISREEKNAELTESSPFFYRCQAVAVNWKREWNEFLPVLEADLPNPGIV